MKRLKHRRPCLTHPPFGGSPEHFTFCAEWTTLPYMRFTHAEVLMPDQRLISPRTASPTMVGARVRQLRIARWPDPDATRSGAIHQGVHEPDRAGTGPTHHVTRSSGWQTSSGSSVSYLETGVSSQESERAAGLVVRAEAAISNSEYDEALTCLDGLADSLTGWHPELELRALLCESSARTHRGELDMTLAPAEPGAGPGRRPLLHGSRPGAGSSSTSAGAGTSWRRSRPPPHCSPRLSS